jgi:outer membrane protein TolC
MRKPIDPSSGAPLHRAKVDRARRRLERAIVAVGLMVLCFGSSSAHAQGSASPQPATAPSAAAPGAPTSAAAPTTPAAPAAGSNAASSAAAAPTQTDKGGNAFDLASVLNQGSESMTSDQVAELAVRTGPTLAKARAVVEQSRKAASQALVAVYPRLDLIAQYTRLSKPPAVAYPLPAIFSEVASATGVVCANPGNAAQAQACAQAAMNAPPPGAGGATLAFPLPLVDQYLLQARLSYPVSDLFFAILPRYRAAQESVRAQELRVRAEAQSVALLGKEAFYNYARARAALQVARYGQSQAEAQLKDVESLVRAGTQARVEQMRAEANVAAARVAVARAEGSVAVARTALGSLLHREGEQEIALSEDFSQSLPPLVEDKEQLVRAAFQNRSELRAFELMAGVYDRNEQAAGADKLPKLSISGSAEEGNPNQRAAMFQRKWTGTWEALALLTWSPNDFAAGDARASQAAAQRAQTLADMAALEDALRREVSQAYEDYKASRSAMEAALLGISAAEESYRVRREQFRAGAAVATDVVISEGELNRARLDLVNASIDLRIARARLDRAVERAKAG